MPRPTWAEVVHQTDGSSAARSWLFGFFRENSASSWHGKSSDRNQQHSTCRSPTSSLTTRGGQGHLTPRDRILPQSEVNIVSLTAPGSGRQTSRPSPAGMSCGAPIRLVTSGHSVGPSTFEPSALAARGHSPRGGPFESRLCTAVHSRISRASRTLPGRAFDAPAGEGAVLEACRHNRSQLLGLEARDQYLERRCKQKR